MQINLFEQITHYVNGVPKYGNQVGEFLKSKEPNWDKILNQKSERQLKVK
jgi:hypothetical protein